jgi:hypothetical protein
VTFQGRDIWEYQNLPDSGVQLGEELAQREAARWAHLSYAEFCALTVEEQIGVLAHQRTVSQLEAVRAWWEEEKQRAKNVGRNRFRGRRR